MALQTYTIAEPNDAAIVKYYSGTVAAFKRSQTLAAGETSDIIVEDTLVDSVSFYNTIADAWADLQLEAAPHAVATNAVTLWGDVEFTEVNLSPVDQVHDIGDQITLTCEFTASAGNINYQWYKGRTLISGATSSSISTNSFQADQAGLYFCLMTVSGDTYSRDSHAIRPFRLSVTPVAENDTTIGVGNVDSVAINAAGTGYSDATDVATTGGSGSGLTVDITTSGGNITAATVNFPGENYVNGEVVTVVGGGNDGTLDITVN